MGVNMGEIKLKRLVLLVLSVSIDHIYGDVQLFLVRTKVSFYVKVDISIFYFMNSAQQRKANAFDANFLFE